MLKRLLTTSAALVVVAACSDSPVEAPLERADPVAAFAKADRISICHLDADLGTYFPIMVNGNAETAHRGHGDGQVGDPVPGMEGYEFGESCQPVPPADPGACLALVISLFEGAFGPWSWSDNGPWSVQLDLPGRISIRGPNSALAEVVDNGGGLHSCQISDLQGYTATDLVAANDFSVARAFLLSLTNGS